uniref:extracellular matrix protein 2 isoform X1 n=1 Tax=Solea senegalensis TaxID=28829 RepID=UPI001CD857EB|nr:extracellular matrix protein 2 isoform X1 [Solea senegalensis]
MPSWHLRHVSYDKMEALVLLLLFCTVPGYSHTLQPRAGVAQRTHQSGLRDVSILAEEREHGGNTDKQEMSLETNPARRPVRTVAERGGDGEDVRGREERIETFSQSAILREGEKREDGLDLVSPRTSTIHSDTTKKWSPNSRQQEDEKYEKLRQEERESELVAGISLYETRGDTYEDEKTILGDEMAEKGEDIKYARHNEGIERENEDHAQVPLSRTSSAQVGTETKMAATIQIITRSQNPPTLPPPPREHHHVPARILVTDTQVLLPVSPLPPSSHTSVSPQSFPPAVTLPSPAVSTAVPGEVRSVSLLEDVLFEVLQTPGHHRGQNRPDSKAGPHLEEGIDQKIWFKPVRSELNTTHEAQEINTVVQAGSTFAASAHTATPTPNAAQLVFKESSSEEPNPTPDSTAKRVRFTHEPNTTQPTDRPKSNKPGENDTGASPPRPQGPKPSEQPRPTAAKTPSTGPTKINRGGKKSKEKKRKNASETQRKEEVTAPAYFPYFMDNYCPPECACYGRVVQCSDKGVDKVPYGIPYNSRYILLMNNHIDSIQPDLLSQYVSMEFLVLSNNLLTDGAIEGAFEGVPALKRLYLERNLLEGVPTDLPASLEELRLDDNHLAVMSEAAWAQCPGLLVLSLSNNSLGSESESLPDAVLSPLRQLRTLNLNHNQLTQVPLGLPLSVKELYLKGNHIEQFRGGAFDGTAELLVLDLSANALTNKGLVRDSLLNATLLESLNLEGNKLKQVPRHLPSSLKTLNLKGNFISSIKKAAFSNMKNLEHLGLARNTISRVALGAFRTLPILHQLDLGHNTLLHVPRQLPRGLRSVALAHNKIQAVPRDAFCWGEKSGSPSRLVHVQLQHNFIDMGKLDAQAFTCLRGFQVVHFY